MDKKPMMLGTSPPAPDSLSMRNKTILDLLASAHGLLDEAETRLGVPGDPVAEPEIQNGIFGAVRVAENEVRRLRDRIERLVSLL